MLNDCFLRVLVGESAEGERGKEEGGEEGERGEAEERSGRTGRVSETSELACGNWKQQWGMLSRDFTMEQSCTLTPLPCIGEIC